MAHTSRHEKEMRDKYRKMKENPDLKPMERLRAYMLADGGSCSLKSLHRSVAEPLVI